MGARSTGVQLMSECHIVRLSDQERGEDAISFPALSLACSWTPNLSSLLTFPGHTELIITAGDFAGSTCWQGTRAAGTCVHTSQWWRRRPRQPARILECKGVKVSPCLSKLTGSLLTSRCVKDETYWTYSSPSPRIARFKFSSFHFLNRFPSVYLQCKLVVCRAYDASSRCNRGCVVRSKRDAGSYQEKVDVVLGPIQLQPPTKEKRSLVSGHLEILLPLGPMVLGDLKCFCLRYGPTQTAHQSMY